MLGLSNPNPNPNTLTARIDRNLAYVILGNGHKGIKVKVKGDGVKVTG